MFSSDVLDTMCSTLPRRIDRSATSNLKKHAIACFGEASVQDTIQGNNDAKAKNGSIFAAFARVGQRVVNATHRSHSPIELRARCARWIAESNRPVKIVEDDGFVELMGAGRPDIKLPKRNTVSRDIKTAYNEHPGQINIATDAWTSPNHRAFCAFTAHLWHEGQLLCFLLDIVEVPESHTGQNLAHVFHAIVQSYGIEDKVLGFTGDNATSNDTQTDHLDVNLLNFFNSPNRVRCYNHILNLIVKALLKPFGSRVQMDEDVTDDSVGDVPDLMDVVSDDDNDDDTSFTYESDEDEIEIEWSTTDQAGLTEEVANVKMAIDKVGLLALLAAISKLSFLTYKLS
ncbi:hypothetical protein MPER_09550, partial [Moniliophthora perniciosa FA553]